MPNKQTANFLTRDSFRLSLCAYKQPIDCWGTGNPHRLFPDEKD